ncbi:TetR/AcrR family transcriptional regulator [Nocardia jinanensis]|uniref:TetR family transcriptional regulator n=1 Tax=Nocardia jinanensis TaxID=382504 RepID=A0A917VJU4_9NOCA|nr:TetR/AcrR family transcriptional regulator [Nocardia jinanensis]GGK91422.1 TetR family transcriptional regulator [Nocardia jinanensis]
MTRTSYHHGALREALLAACLRLIETEGIAAVSLRRVAREAGVSSGAPYHHFADRAALLADLATQGFRLLTDQLTTARSTADSPTTALVALEQCYVRFARDQPGYFRLMFRPELSQPEKHPDTRAAGEAAFGVLADAVAACVAAGDLAPERAEPTTLTLWALGHGLASLWLDGQLDKRGSLFGTTATALVDSVIDGIPGFLDTGTGPPRTLPLR